MSNALFLPSRLAARGASVRLVAGWEARTAMMTLASGQRVPRPLYPKYLVCHHTASVPWSSAASNLNVCVNGNGVAPGPISQTLVQRDGSVDVVAAGSANHAGAGTYPDGSSGNSYSYGIEAVNSGIVFGWNPNSSSATWGGNTYTLTASSNALMKKRADLGEIVQSSPGVWYEPWSEKCLLGYAANVLAYLDEHDAWTLDQVISHQSYAPSRKIDPSGPWFDAPTTNLKAADWMARFKSLLTFLDQPTPPTPPVPPIPPTQSAPLWTATGDPDMLRFVKRAADPANPYRWLCNGMVRTVPTEAQANWLVSTGQVKNTLATADALGDDVLAGLPIVP